ncbi:MAG: hypothetical protein LQ351_002371 [Letrouitia transgressa]|nr:MAG: hypothetical protein LQ351_002371 [Letrouitia transgressa]
MTQESRHQKSLVELLGGLLAGLASSLVSHPLDLIKTRLQIDQSSSSQFGSSFRIAREAINHDGVTRGLYRGLSPNLIGNSVSWALYFLCYGGIKDRLGADQRGLTYYEYFIASGTAGSRPTTTKSAKLISLGTLTVICTNPIWVVKTRMLSTAASHPQAYQSITHGVRHILRSEGFRGFYRGLTPSLFGVTHGAFQFMAYEQLKEVVHSSKPDERKMLTAFDYVWTSSAAKIFASTTTYPYQVVRSRLQTYEAGRNYLNAKDTVAKIWQREGLRGFYKGLSPNLFRVLPSTWVTFLVYEEAKALLPYLIDQRQ